jgi:hypothetical protein
MLVNNANTPKSAGPYILVKKGEAPKIISWLSTVPKASVDTLFKKAEFLTRDI